MKILIAFYFRDLKNNGSDMCGLSENEENEPSPQSERAMVRAGKEGKEKIPETRWKNGRRMEEAGERRTRMTRAWSRVWHE